MSFLLWGVFISFYSLVSCQSVPANYKVSESHALTTTSDTFFGRLLAPSIEANPGKSGFYPLQAGTDAFVARLESVRRAQKSLDVQYYIWHDDLVGKILFYEILAAADRGVRVRLLLDDLHIGQYEELLLVLDSHPFIEVRMFNPFANRSLRFLDVFRFSQINRRMHNKVLIADNQTAIIGGRNIGNEYFTASPDENFGDFDVWCFGPVVKESSQSFDLYWNHRLSVPIKELNKREVQGTELASLQNDLKAVAQSEEAKPYLKELAESSLAKSIENRKVHSFWGKAQVFSDSPEKVAGESYKKTSMLNQVTALPIKSSKEIFIVSPYFIPGKNGVEYFKKKSKEGVKVTVFTNSLASNDVPLVFAGYKKYRKGLLKVGVEIYEMRPRISAQKKKFSSSLSAGARLGLHGKAYVFDRRVMFVGSMNLDPRSVELNSEMGVLFESPELAQKFVELTLNELPDVAYKVTLNEGKLQWTTQEGENQVTVESEPEASVWKSFKAGFLSLFVPESML
ncbi:phospholipase D family protein [Bdellovibrio sp. BCCA]|uniref:phospholipase D family protein n=1 Tax=Bdellovibrio sp. BCCA TaxID=3136281 RepID=UPI0030F2C2FF